MKYIIEYKNKKWTLEEVSSIPNKGTNEWMSTQIFRKWSPKEEEREWWCYSLKNSSGAALEDGQKRIREYIKERENPITLARSIMAGNEEGCRYEEIFHELSKAVIWLDARLRDIEQDR